MITIRYLGSFLLSTAATITTASGVAIAQPTHHADAAPRETIVPAFSNPISNIPGKSLMAVVVSYPPGGKTPPHMHAKSAFITGYVLSGAIRSKVDNGNERVFRTGESWTEKPGAHHGMSENASATKPASLLAIFVVDSNEKNLTTLVGK
jgi:quercetin dioxygenase-like cupin family protein